LEAAPHSLERGVDSKKHVGRTLRKKKAGKTLLKKERSFSSKDALVKPQQAGRRKEACVAKESGVKESRRKEWGNVWLVGPIIPLDAVP